MSTVKQPSATRLMIKAAVDGLFADHEKLAVVPVSDGQIPPPQGNVTPPMPPGGMPAGGPPMDPAMMGGLPPGMDPSMMGPPPGAGGPPGGMPPGMPMDPSMMGPPPGPPPADNVAPGAGGDPKDPLVPISAMTTFATSIIEATKGKRTADPKDPAAGGVDPNAPVDPAQAAIANLGGAPADAPMPLPGMGAGAGGMPGKAAEATLSEILAKVAKARGTRR